MAIQFIEHHLHHEFEKPICLETEGGIQFLRKKLEDFEEAHTKKMNEAVLEMLEMRRKEVQKILGEVEKEVQRLGKWPSDFRDTDHLMFKDGVVFYARCTKKT